MAFRHQLFQFQRTCFTVLLNLNLNLTQIHQLSMLGIGLMIFLILYDQRARDSEYGVNLVPGSQIPALPGQTVIREIIIENTGNVSDSYALTADWSTPHWESYFTYDNGASIIRSSS